MKSIVSAISFFSLVTAIMAVTQLSRANTIKPAPVILRLPPRVASS